LEQKDFRTKWNGDALKAGASLFLTILVVPTYIWLVTAGSRFYNPPKIVTAPKELSGITKLGEFLFNDTNLSEPKGQACVTCHDPKLKRQGNSGSSIIAVAAGSRPAVFGNRNVPTAMYAYDIMPFRIEKILGADGKVEYIPMGGLFWDGRADSLAAQAKSPMLNALEMNNPNIETVVSKVKASAYAPLVTEVFGAGIFNNPAIAIEKIAESIAAYERTSEFSPFSSRFDEYLKGSATLTDLEAQGFELFKNPQKGNCISCHVGKQDSYQPEDWLFTDYTYDVLGAPRNLGIPENSDAQNFDLGLCEQPGIEKKIPIGFDVNNLCGAFKVPTLRNVAETGPYFHNGSITTLRDAVEFYVTRDVNPERWYPKNQKGEVRIFDDLPEQYHRNVNIGEIPYGVTKNGKARLNDEEIDAVVAFLNTLTDVQGAD
jgi:cytochrome c peroxidase